MHRGEGGERGEHGERRSSEELRLKDSAAGRPSLTYPKGPWSSYGQESVQMVTADRVQ